MNLVFDRRLRTAGRFTIPHEIIDVLRIKRGDKVYFNIRGIPVPFAGTYSADTRFTIPVNIRHLFNLRLNDFIAVSITGINTPNPHGWVL